MKNGGFQCCYSIKHFWINMVYVLCLQSQNAKRLIMWLLQISFGSFSEINPKTIILLFVSVHGIKDKNNTSSQNIYTLQNNMIL